VHRRCFHNGFISSRALLYCCKGKVWVLAFKQELFSVTIITLLLVSSLVAAFSIQPTETGGTICARANSSTDPPTAQIEQEAAILSEAPPTEWNKTYGGTSDEAAIALVQTADGGYALAGSTLSYGAGNVDFWLVKTDASGNELWNKTYGGTDYDGAYAYALVQTGDGGYALAGNTNSFGAGGTDFWLVKVAGSATGTICIRADGSIDPSTAPISSVDNVTYTFTDNIYDPIIVERDNIVVDGAGYTVQGTGSGTGLSLSGRSNVTIKNTSIDNFNTGILLDSSSNNSISGNNITGNNDYGIFLQFSPNNSIVENNITGNGYIGILLNINSSDSSISGNNIANNDIGIYVSVSNNSKIVGNEITANKQYGIYHVCSSNNSIVGNNIAENGCGIYLHSSSNNIFYHNNFLNNMRQVYDHSWEWPYPPSINTWDDGYPSGGNYWSDYTGVDANGDGIGDTPYVIDANNQDRYPLINPWTPTPPAPDFSITASLTSLTIQQGSSDTSVVTITSIDGFSQPVQLGVSGAPSGVTATLNPEQVTPLPDGSAISTLTVSVATTATLGSYTLTVAGTNGALTHSTYISLEITASSPAEWTFAIITDLHIGFGYPDYGPEGPFEVFSVAGEDYYLTERLTKIVESINKDPRIRFVTVLGDISDSAEPSEFLKARRILNGLTAPYIPLIGNHDIWPYTQKAPQDKRSIEAILEASLDKIPRSNYDPDIREKDREHSQAFGDESFNNVFWGEDNKRNVEKIEALFGTSWRRQFTIHEVLSETGTDQNMQNYVFTYGGIKFIALDFSDRAQDKSGGRLYGVTADWLRNNLVRDERTIILSHHPAIFMEIDFPGLGVQCLGYEDSELIQYIIRDSGADLVACFGGHSHANFDVVANYDEHFLRRDPIEINGKQLWQGATLADCRNGLDSSVVITEAVCTESIKWAKRIAGWAPELASKFPLRTDTNESIRIVTVFGNGAVEYSELDSVRDEEDANLPPTSYFTHDWRNPTTFEAFPFDPDPPWEDATWSFKYSWSFDTRKDDKKAKHMFPHSGTYIVILKVTDEKGASSSTFDEVTVPDPRPWWKIWSSCPVDLVVTDPDGITISKTSGTVPGMVYKELDVDGDGDLDDVVEIWEQKTGEYLITVIPEPDADPTDTYTLEIISENTIIALAKDITISDIPTQPYTVEYDEAGLSQKVRFDAVWDSFSYPVFISSDSTVANFVFNQSLMQTSFEVSGETGAEGYCNVTIPKTLLKGENWTVKINGVDWNFTPSGNATHSFVYFTYTHASTLQVVIQGTWVIPEFPSATILTVFMALTLLATALIRKKRTRRLV
jgi:parallel beta-helix repeat protein